MSGHRVAGMRGGLVVRPSIEPARDGRARTESNPSMPLRRRRLGDADEQILTSASLRSVRWSLAYIGFVVYLFVITTYQLRIGDVSMALALFGLLFLKQRLVVPGFLLWLIAFLAWCSLGVLHSRYPGVVYEQVVVLGKLCLIVLVAVNVLRGRSNLRLVLLLFVFFYALYPARGAIFNYLSGYTLFGRTIWNFVYSNSNDLAAITLLQLSLAAGLLVTERARSWYWWGALAAIVVLPVVILMTKSRGVFLGLAAFSALGILGQRRRLRSICIGAALVAAVMMLAPSGSFSRLGGLGKALNESTRAEADPEGSAEQRYKIWTVAWAIISDFPLTGVGWGAYPFFHQEYSPRVDPTGMSRGPRDTHSTYFNLIAETGYPGFFLFALLVGGTALYAERIRRRCRDVIPATAQQLFFLELGLLGYMVAGIFASYSRISFLYLHLALIYATAQACQDDLALLSPGRVERR